MFFEAKALAFVMLGVLFTSSFTTGTSGEPAALERKPPFRRRGLFFQTPNSAAHIAPTHPSKVNQILSQWLNRICPLKLCANYVASKAPNPKQSCQWPLETWSKHLPSLIMDISVSLFCVAFFHCLDVLYQHATLPTRPKSPQINTNHGKV